MNDLLAVTASRFPAVSCILAFTTHELAFAPANVLIVCTLIRTIRAPLPFDTLAFD